MESLSITAMEAWSYGKPVIAWRKSSVLAGQIERSGGGYSFGDFEEFRSITEKLDSKVGLRGWDYVKRNYSWETVLPAYEEVFQKVADQKQ
jgi:glycosyltransferase involved in cell wall biosynthesis